ncbi:MAG: DUF1800 domain-containing protein [Chloroflexi bacterium]|nr:DUF1800 domain-containing protein [Chloroflexota bacterium]
MAPSTTRNIGHLLRRAGFGATPDEVSTYTAKGLGATVDELVNYEQRPNPVDTTLGAAVGDLLDLSNLEDVQTIWLYRMINTSRPLEEKMTLFGHGHFATAQYKVNNATYMHGQNETLRKYATGNFKDLVTAISQDPAMLIWLDGATNYKNAPNENFGRELMELFTLGIGNYTEDDVKAAARAFTGWNLDRAKGQFVFNPKQHDDGPKTFRGQTGALNGSDIIVNVVADPATAKRIATKLFAFFAYDNPEPEVIQPLADVFSKNGYEIKPLVQAILTSDAFYSDKSFTAHLKSPVEFVAGTVRQFGGKIRERSLLPALRQLGQELYNPPNVAGWPSGPAWMSPSAIMTRFNFGALLSGAIKNAPGPLGGGYIDPESFVQKLPAKSWPAVISLFGDSLTGGLTDETKQTLSDYTASAASLTPQALDTKLRGLIHLLMVSPEYQVA